VFLKALLSFTAQKKNFLLDYRNNIVKMWHQYVNLWSYIKQKRRANLSKSREETILEIQTLWKDISIDYIHSLVQSVPKRLPKVIDAKRGYIFY